MFLKFLDIVKQVARIKLLQHFLFWCLSFLILINILKVSSEIKRIDIIYTLIFHLPVVLVVYLNLKVLFPVFLEKGRYFIYCIFVVATIMLGSAFYILLFDNWIDHIFKGYYFIAYYGFWDISLYFLVYLAATSLISLARGWFRLREIENEKTLTELRALKSQVNPHFLFNSLNSIYSLARKKSDAAPEKIVQLSNLMRHIIYESEADFISIESEVEMIKNYIELQNLRSGEREQVKFEITGNVNENKIAPLLFLPFVENSFKHGVKSKGEDIYVDIRMDISSGMLNFKIINNKGFSVTVNESKYKGIGIENVKKRLELIYPGRHQLTILDDGNSFKVILQIRLN